MTYPTVLLHLDDDAREEARNEQAVRLALHLGCHLTGLACPRPVPAGSGFASSLGGLDDALALELEHAREQARVRERRFLGLCERLRLPSFETELEETDAPGRAILHRMGRHDLAILGQPDPAAPGAARRRAAVEEVILHSPRPSLLLPYAGRFDAIGRTALVAWDGSHAAARAASDALPLLKRAGAVHLVAFERDVGEPRTLDHASLSGVARWFGRHAVDVQARACFPGTDVGNALLSHAADVGADLLVMGCWGHARLAERLLGGATRTVLESMTLPVLTSR
ncbi:MAG: universal stress protein [Burkholderiaceae bacterium]